MKRNGKFCLLYCWLEKAHIFWLVICPLFLFYTLFSFYCTDKIVHLVGFVFQFFGLVCTVIVLYRTKKFFDYPNLCQRFKSFVKEFPFYKKKETHANGYMVAPLADCTAEAHENFNPKENDIEKRLAYVEEYIEYVSGWIVRNKQDVDLKIAEVERDFFKERNLRIARDEKIESVVKGNAIGSVILAEISICYFFFGSIISSFSSEIEDFFR